MSEFSESYHLRSESPGDAIQLLRRAKRKGFVYESTNGWVTFLPEKGNFEPDQQVVAAATLPLLHYVSAEDHGWSFTLYNGAKVVSAYRCDWDDTITVGDSNYSRAALEQLIPSLNPALLDQLEARLHPQEFEELSEVDASK